MTRIMGDCPGCGTKEDFELPPMPLRVRCQECEKVIQFVINGEDVTAIMEDCPNKNKDWHIC